MSEYSKAFGKRLREARKAAGMCQEELGDLVVYGHNTVRAWEEGKRLPHLDIACQLALHLGVTVGWLVAGEGER
jgi:transcriptional regulator with XRE-family HTH domain